MEAKLIKFFIFIEYFLRINKQIRAKGLKIYNDDIL